MAGGLVLAPRVVVDAPPARPPTVGLLRSAIGPVETTDGRWTGGFEYAPENAGQVATLDPTADSGIGTGGLGNTPQVTFTPYVIEAGDRCSSLGFAARDYQGRAERLLEAATSKGLESELWTGAAATLMGLAYPDADSEGHPLGNRSLVSSSATDVTGGATPVTPVAALALLEQAGTAGNGEQAFIHANRALVTYWVANRLVERQGNLLLTMLGTVVVPGAGYPGTGPTGNAHATPAAGATWAYLTDPVTVRLGDIHTPAADFHQTLDRATNTVEVRANRFAAATWDGRRHYAVYVDLT